MHLRKTDSGVEMAVLDSAFCGPSLVAEKKIDDLALGAREGLHATMKHQQTTRLTKLSFFEGEEWTDN